jgi:threonine dehydrogenase-like Zn-dependent dehydrogenase
MGRVVVFTQPRTINIDTYEDRPAATEVRLRMLYSGISAGTELTAYRGSNPYIHKKWDEVGTGAPGRAGLPLSLTYCPNRNR